MTVKTLLDRAELWIRERLRVSQVGPEHSALLKVVFVVLFLLLALYLSKNPGAIDF